MSYSKFTNLGSNMDEDFYRDEQLFADEDREAFIARLEQLVEMRNEKDLEGKGLEYPNDKTKI